MVSSVDTAITRWNPGLGERSAVLSKALIDADCWLCWFIQWFATAGMILLSHYVLTNLPWFHNEIVLYFNEFSVFLCHWRFFRKLLSRRSNGSIGCFRWFATSGMIQLSHCDLRGILPCFRMTYCYFFPNIWFLEATRGSLKALVDTT